METETEPRWKTPLKYFLHGILFSALFLVLGLVWAVLFVVLIAIGLFIGFIIGCLVLFFLVGGLNTFLTDAIWSIPLQSGWKSLLSHGFILFILLVIVGIPSFIVSLIEPSMTVRVITFIVYAFIDGFVAKNVAGWWEEEGEESFD